MRRSPLFFAALLLFVISLFSCTDGLFRRRLASVSQTGMELGTYVKITIITAKKEQKEAQKTIDEAFRRIKELDRTFDYRKEGGQLWMFNRGSVFYKKNEEDLFSLLQYSLDIAEATDGFFDPTILPVVQVWGFDTESPRLPERYEIECALENVGYETVRVFDDRIEKPDSVKLDLSGVAKGRVVDLIREYLRNKGHGNFLIDAGGDIYVSGKNAHRRRWRIAIQDPENSSGFRGVIEKTDTAIVTSGDYERFFIEEGMRYSHLFNPKTGYPHSDLKSVTVLLYDTAFADAVATAVFAMGSERGYEFLIHNGIEGYIIYEDSEGEMTSKSTPDFWN